MSSDGDGSKDSKRKVSTSSTSGSPATTNEPVWALTSACKNKTATKLRKLLEQDEYKNHINSKNEDGDAPIHIACKEKNLAAVRLLFQQGAQKWIMNSCGASAMQIAIFRDDLKTTKFLVKDLEENNPAVTLEFGRTPLHYAAIFGRYEILEWLLKNGADPNACMEGEKTPAHVIFAQGSALTSVVTRSCLDALVDAGADLTLFDKQGRKPIHLANNEILVNYWTSVLEFDLDEQDQKGFTLLHYVCEGSAPKNLFKYLLRCCANIHARTDFGDTPLHLAARHCCLQMSLDLFKQGADVKARDMDGRNPLHVSLMYHKPQRDLIRFLKEIFLPGGGNVNDSTDTGWTALHYATFYNLADFQAVLLENGASLTERTIAGHTPLHMIGTKDIRVAPGTEEVTLQEALDGRISSNRRAPSVKRFSRDSDDDEVPQIICTEQPWAAQHQWTYESLLRIGTNCTERDMEGNLPFFLAAATEWTNATFSMVRVAASQGLFETLRNESQSAVQSSQSSYNTDCQ